MLTSFLARGAAVLTVGLVVALAPASPTAADAAPTADALPLPGAHSHNDYDHPRPLVDALEHGFTSVEADVWLTDGKLCLGHAAPDCSMDLEKTYLRPLQARVDARGGSVYAGWTGTFQLLVDIKTDGETTWPEVEKALAKYPGLLRHWEAGRRVEGPVMAVISGKRSKTQMLSATNRWSACDGTPGDIGRFDPEFMPLVSASWWDEFSWRGAFAMPDDQRLKLIRLTDLAHVNGQQIRFYATPDLNDPVTAAKRKNVWDAERAAGVDWLNTDHPAVVEAYLR